MNKNMIVAVVLVVLVAIAVVQTVQLTNLKTKIASSGLSMKTSNSNVASQSGHSSGQAASSLDNLPSMVGGC